MSNLYDKVVSVISKPPEIRQDFEVHNLVPWFRKKSQMFSQLKTEIVMDIVRNCKFVSHVRDDVIIQQGDQGDCFYIILGGQISIYILNKDKEGEDEREEVDQVLKRGKDGKLDRTKLGNFVTHLGAGSPFGEVALASDSCIRTASIIADENTDLVVVDRALYNRSVRDVLAKEFHNKEMFIMNNQLFSSWAPKYRKQLAMAMYMKTYSYESMLVRQAEPTECMYFILSGQVEVQIDPSMHPLQYRKIFLAANQSEAEKLLRKAERARPPTEHQNNNNIKKRDNFKSMKICYLGINESVGDVEMLLDLNTYMHTAVCKERTEVLVLELKHYERLFVRRHQRTIDAMRDQLGVKLETRISLLTQKEDIPLLGYLHKKILSRYRPPPPADRDKKDMATVSEAEREFLNHKGPLIDMFGPGSVFYMIRVREKTKEKLRNKRERKMDRIPPHVHAVSLPQSLLMAAGGLRDSDDGGRNRDGPRSFKRIQSAQNKEKEQDSFEEYPDAMEYDDDDYDPYTNGVTIDQDAHDAALTNLEERIRMWLRRENPKTGPKVAQLRRLAIQDMDIQPRPGNRVVIRRRKPPLTASLLDQSPRETDRDKLSHLKILLTN